MRVTYAGHEALTFTDYLNLETGQTLSAVPGGVYDIAPASGRVVPEVPEPWFTLAEPKALEAAPDLWSAADESGEQASAAPEDEHGTEEG